MASGTPMAKPLLLSPFDVGLAGGVLGGSRPAKPPTVIVIVGVTEHTPAA